jgi:hypothetical protein
MYPLLYLLKEMLANAVCSTTQLEQPLRDIQQRNRVEDEPEDELQRERPIRLPQHLPVAVRRSGTFGVATGSWWM